MEIIQTVLGFIVAIVVLVAVHEFGHFYVARLCGIKVLRFCIGLGKPLFSIYDKRGTEFALAPLPFGGYVKLLDSREVDVPAEEAHLSFNSKSVWQRIAVLAAGPAANFVLAIALFWVVMMGRGEITYAPIIGEVAPASLAEQAGLEVGQEIVAVDGSSTAGRVAVLEQLFRRLGETGVIALKIKNPQSDLLFDVEIPIQGWMAGVKDPNPAEGLGLSFYLPEIQLGEPTPDSAAEAAGLRSGDVFVALDEQKKLDLEAVIAYIRARPNQSMTLHILRAGSERDIAITPKAVTQKDGSVIGQFGVQMGYRWPDNMVRTEHYGVFESFGRAVGMTWSKSQFVLASMSKLVVREISVNNLSGPIGIAKVAGDHARAGFLYFLDFLALLSVYLGVLNLLPIPILDGGQIFYCLIEAVRGRPLSEKVQAMGFSVGLTVLVLVMFVAIYNDILRLQ